MAELPAYMYGNPEESVGEVPASGEQKRCSMCKQELPVILFSKNKSTLDGLAAECKKCCRARRVAYDISNPGKSNDCSAAWRKANPEKARAAVAAWHKANSEKIKAYKKAWAKANKEKVRGYQAAYCKNNPEKITEKNRIGRKKNRAKILLYQENYRATKGALCRQAIANWHKANPEKQRIYLQNRRARKRANGGVLSSGLAEKLFTLQKGRCACCSELLGSDYHLDHIMPIVLGGKNEDWNIQLLRKSCNQKKHKKHPVDFMQSRGFLL